jgi:hypothetical protein
MHAVVGYLRYRRINRSKNRRVMDKRWVIYRSRARYMNREWKLNNWNVIAMHNATDLEANSHDESPLLDFNVKIRRGGLIARYDIYGGHKPNEKYRCRQQWPPSRSAEVRIPPQRADISSIIE